MKDGIEKVSLDRDEESKIKAKFPNLAHEIFALAEALEIEMSTEAVAKVPYVLDIDDGNIAFLSKLNEAKSGGKVSKICSMSKTRFFLTKLKLDEYDSRRMFFAMNTNGVELEWIESPTPKQIVDIYTNPVECDDGEEDERPSVSGSCMRYEADRFYRSKLAGIHPVSLYGMELDNAVGIVFSKDKCTGKTNGRALVNKKTKLVGRLYYHPCDQLIRDGFDAAVKLWASRNGYKLDSDLAMVGLRFPIVETPDLIEVRTVLKQAVLPYIDGTTGINYVKEDGVIEIKFQENGNTGGHSSGTVSYLKQITNIWNDLAMSSECFDYYSDNTQYIPRNILRLVVMIFKESGDHRTILAAGIFELLLEGKWARANMFINRFGWMRLQRLYRDCLSDFQGHWFCNREVPLWLKRLLYTLCLPSGEAPLSVFVEHKKKNASAEDYTGQTWSTSVSYS
jgi:hypothetical protein